MKSEQNNQNIVKSYELCLIYTIDTSNNWHALALFEADDDPRIALIADRQAENRLSSLVFAELDNMEPSLDSIKVALKHENLILTKNVRKIEVRLSKNLDDFDDGYESYYHWDMNSSRGLLGGLGVIPIDKPYTIFPRNVVHRMVSITPYLGGKSNA